MSQTLTATGPLLRFAARRYRVKLSIWVLGRALRAVHDDGLQGCLRHPGGPRAARHPHGQPVTDAVHRTGLRARNVDPTELTHQIIFASVYWLYLLIFVALMNILLVSRHTRMQETGRAELVRASVVGRLAPLTSALLLALGANVWWWAGWWRWADRLRERRVVVSAAGRRHHRARGWSSQASRW